MRIKNSLLNVFYNSIFNFFIIIFNFILKKLIVNYIGIELIGLNNILNQIINILTLSELGLSSVFSYYLYSPIKDNNIDEIGSIMTLFKKVYNFISVIIFLLGIILSFLLHFFINDYSLNLNFYFIYFLLLINTSSSYLFSYKFIFMDANQQKHRYLKYKLILKVIFSILEISIFYFYHNYYLFLILDILFNIAINYVLSSYITSIYPFFNEKYIIDNNRENNIIKEAKNTLISKISGTITSSSDTIILGLLSTVSVVGLYSNYYLVLNSIRRIIDHIFDDVKSSVANKIYGDNDSKYYVFSTLCFVAFVFGIVISICYYIFIDIFLKWWIGNYLFSNLIVVCFSIQLFVLIFRIPLWHYTTINGLFKVDRNSAIIGCISNIILSFLLYYFLGVSGIIMATIITQLWQYFYKLYNLFKILELDFYKMLIKIMEYLFIFILFLVISIFLKLFINNILLVFILLLVMLLFIYIFYRNSFEFNYIKSCLKIRFKN